MFQLFSETNRGPKAAAVGIAAGLMGLCLSACDGTPAEPALDTAQDELVVVESDAALSMGWTLRMPMSLRDARPSLAPTAVVYRVHPEGGVTGLDDIGAVFGVTGDPDEVEQRPGQKHAQEGDRHVYAHADGTFVFHEAERVASEDPMTPLPVDELYAIGQELIGRFGLDEVPRVSLHQGRTGEHTMELYGPDGSLEDAWIAHQAVHFEQRIDGAATFGPGAEVEIVVADAGEVVAFSHAIRALEPIDAQTALGPGEAIVRFMDRAVKTHRWNLYRVFVGSPHQLDVTDVTLGYYIPEAGHETDTIEPVYRITARMYGIDTDGTALDGEVLWYEPAIAGRSLTALAIEPITNPSDAN